MNRSERRRLERQGYNKKAIMDKYSEELYEKGFKDGMRHVEECVFYMTAYTLYYKLNWDNLKSGEKKLRQIMYDIFNNIDAFRTGHLTRSDYEEIKEQIKKMKVELK